MPSWQTLLDLWHRTNEALPYAPLVMLLGVVGSVAAGFLLAAMLKLPAWQVVGALMSASLIAAITLTPAGGQGSGQCLYGAMLPGGSGGLFHRSDSALNVWLFVPLGFFLGLLPRWRLVWLLLAMASPWVVEGAQMGLARLGRQCEVQDLLDNSLGVLVGFVVGTLLSLAVAAVTRAGRN